MKISLLDQSMIVSGRSPDASIRETVALAQLCDRLGYHRFWVSEHHSSDAIAGTAPEVLLGALAVTTGRIRLGSAGIMLPHYSALKVAENFRVLEALAPGRIDLGLGRAPGSDGRTAFALNPNAANAAAQFPAQVRDVIAWTSDAPLPEAHPFKAIRAQPTGPHAPEVWILGSSDYGAQVAAYFGLPYCFAYFFSDGQGAQQAMQIYRDTYQPSARHPEPHAAMAVFAIAADTEDAAENLFQSREAWRTQRERGIFGPLPSPAEAAHFAYTEPERARLPASRAKAIFGTADHVARRLDDLALAHGADELALVTATHDPRARRHSFELLASAFGMVEMAV